MSTSQRFLLVSGKNLAELTDALNDPDAQYSRIVYVEKTRAGYTAMLDTYALVIIHIGDLHEDEEAEAARRQHNHMLLQQMFMKTSETA